MDRDGNYYSANAVGDTKNGHNVFMDRDGNIYTGIGGMVSVQDKPYGIAGRVGLPENPVTVTSFTIACYTGEKDGGAPQRLTMPVSRVY